MGSSVERRVGGAELALAGSFYFSAVGHGGSFAGGLGARQTLGESLRDSMGIMFPGVGSVS